MKRCLSLPALALAAALAWLPSLASAAPVSFAFSGSVTGLGGSHTHVLNDFPVGTSASFNLSFDDSVLTPTHPPSFDLGPASGQLGLGTGVWQLNHGHISAYQYQNPTGEVNWYQLQFTGTGPSVSDNGELFGLFLLLTPDLQLAPGITNPIMAGFGYTRHFGECCSTTSYSYAALDGQFSRTGQVPEPASLALVGLAFVGLTFARRRFI